MIVSPEQNETFLRRLPSAGWWEQSSRRFRFLVVDSMRLRIRAEASARQDKEGKVVMLKDRLLARSKDVRDICWLSVCVCRWVQIE